MSHTTVSGRADDSPVRVELVDPPPNRCAWCVAADPDAHQWQWEEAVTVIGGTLACAQHAAASPVVAPLPQWPALETKGFTAHQPDDDWQPLTENVLGQALGPYVQHDDGRTCGFHNRLRVWAFDSEKQCLREHDTLRPGPQR